MGPISMPPTTTVARGRCTSLPMLCDRAAGNRPIQADSAVISAREHYQYLETDHSLLAIGGGEPVGFLLSEPLDDALFIVEIAVHQQWQGRGIGRMMLTRVADTARSMGYPALTLTTFREVPWNAPFYRGLGFTETAPNCAFKNAACSSVW